MQLLFASGDYLTVSDGWCGSSLLGSLETTDAKDPDGQIRTSSIAALCKAEINLVKEDCRHRTKADKEVRAILVGTKCVRLPITQTLDTAALKI